MGQSMSIVMNGSGVEGGGLCVADDLNDSDKPVGVQATPANSLITANFRRVPHAVLPQAGRRSLVTYQKQEVMEAGRIMEIGTHADLVNAGGYYAELERVQREGAEEEDFARARSKK